MVIKNQGIFKTEGPWSDANEKMLALDTGGWRTERPVLDKSLCNYCGLCSLYCPPSTVCPFFPHPRLAEYHSDSRP